MLISLSQINIYNSNLTVGTYSHSRSPDSHTGSNYGIHITNFKKTIRIIPEKIYSYISRKNLPVVSMSAKIKINSRRGFFLKLGGLMIYAYYKFFPVKILSQLIYRSSLPAAAVWFGCIISSQQDNIACHSFRFILKYFYPCPLNKFFNFRRYLCLFI